MRGFLVAAAILSMTVSAYAQTASAMQQAVHEGVKGNDNGGGRPPEPKQPRANEKEYKSSLERLPDKKYDPWGKVR
jgi:hypothetical protein